MAIRFMERLAGMIFAPRDYSNKIISEPYSRKRFLINLLFIQFVSIFSGINLMFTFLYPELYWFPDAIKSGASLYIISLGDPILLMIVFLVGYLLIFGINFLFFGVIHYGIGKIMTRGQQISHGGWKGFLNLYGFSLAPMVLFGVFNVFWIFFFEKINYASINFPFVDFTMPVTIYFIVLITLFIWRWGIQVRISQQYFNISVKKSLVPILVHVLLIIAFIVLAIYFGNQLALQFA